MESETAAGVRVVLTDIDDTLTTHGRLTTEAYAALASLQAAGIRVVPITGRPAGWCDLIARFWPVDGVVGENGAFYFRYARDRHLMQRVFLYSDEQRLRDRKQLLGFFARLQRNHPKLALAADQPFRVSDIAIDI